MLHCRAGRIARPSPARRLNLETLETREVPASFTAGNLAVLLANGIANNTTASIVEINTTTANQSAVQTIAIPGTGTDAIRISGSATSTGYLSTTKDGSLLTFTGHNSTDTTVNANTLNPRAVVTLNASGSSALATTYTGTSGNQTRSATSLDNSTWIIADQGGVYTNNSTAASPTGNFRAARTFGDTVYLGRASGTAGTTEVVTLSAATGGTVTGLSGLNNNAAHQDFFLIQSGSNGTTFDVLYTLSATSITAGTVAKYSFVDTDGNGSLDTWSANGTFTTTFGGFGLAAADMGTTDGAFLYATTGTGATAANSVIKLTDTAGYNSTISITTANNVTLFTAATGTTLKGVTFVPTAANQAPVVTLNGTDVSYTENAATPTILASAATVTDADSNNFDTGMLTVAFGANGTADDRLAINNEGTGSGQIGVSGSNVTFGGTTIGSFTGGTGTTPLVVTLNANATPTATQALVRNITFANGSENPTTANRRVDFTLTDGDGGTSSTVSRTVTVTAVNDAPVVTVPASQMTDEDTPRVFSTANGNAISVSDVDAGTGSVTVMLTTTRGTLMLATTTGLTVSGNGTGTVTLSGMLADINAGLNGLTFTPAMNFNGPATVMVSANDNGNTGSGGALSDSKTVNITVTSVNDAPAGTDGSATINEDTSYTFSAADFGFTDPNDTPPNAFAGIVVSTLPTAGTLTNNGTAVTNGRFVSASDIAAGFLVFTPVADANGTPYASFTFQVRDDGGTANGGQDTDQSPNTFTINVTAVNDAPIVTLSQNSVTATVNTAFALDMFAMFAPGGGTDEATQTAQSYSVTATNGALFTVAPAISPAGRLTFTASGTPGTTTVRVTVTDSAGATSTQVQFSVTVQAAPVTPAPQPPVNVTVDPTARFIAAGADAGGTGTVALFDARTGVPLISFQPFGNYGGGVAVALGDLTGDGVAELVVATRGSIGLLSVYDLATGATLVSGVRPFAGLNTGLQITIADMDGDGVQDLVFSPERGAPSVAGFSFVKGQFVSFANPLPGANLNFQMTAGNVTGDARAEVILSANGTVAVLDAFGAVLSVIPVAPGFTGDMSIAVGDTNGDGKREIVVALQGPGADTVLAGFSAEGALVWSLFADTGAGLRRDGTNRPAVTDAPSLAVADVTGDGIADILLGSQTGMGTSRVTVVNGATQQTVRNDVAFGPLSQTGVFTDAG
jgi:hypothetical protein